MKESFVRLSGDAARQYVGAFSCAPPARPFLVRAVYGHRATGGYYVQRLESTLFVTHSSLGRSTPTPTKSALVVCAEDVSDVFVVFGVAE